MQIKVFDLDTARETLVVIKPIVEEINAKRMELTEAYERLQRSRTPLKRCI
jgi:Uncharacterized conserved protein (DUF2203).